MKINLYLFYVMFACLFTVSSTAGLIYFYDVVDDFNIADIVKPQSPLKVMLLVDNKFNDGGWSESHVDGFLEAVNQVGAIGEVHDNIRKEECLNYIDEFARRGGDMVIAPSSGYNYCLNIATKKYPNVKFLGIISDELKPSPNLITFFAKAYKIRYLAGIIAAFASKSDSFGYLVAVENPETIRGLNAYTLGIRLIRPNAKVYFYSLGSWYSQKNITTSLRKLLAQHPDIDVISYHVSSDEVEMFCDGKGIKTISYNKTKYDRFPTTNLTSIDWNWGSLYKVVIANTSNGNFEPKTMWIGLRVGSVRLGKINKTISHDAYMLVDRKISEFQTKGKDVFDGPIYDNKGNLKIKAGTKLSEEDMLYRMNWYVDGVEECKDEE